MTALPTSGGTDWARILAAIGSGLQQAGTPGGNFSAGVQQGAGFYDQGQDRKLQQERDKLADELRRIEIENARTANSDAAAQKKRIADFIAQQRGPQMPPNGMSQAQFGGAPVGPQDPYWTPERLGYLEAFPDQADDIIGQKLFPAADDPVKGVEIGGMLVNPITGEPIADFTEQELKLRTASRPSTTVNMGPTGIDYGEPEKGLAWARNQDGTVRLDERGAPIALPYQGGSVFSAEQEALKKQAGSDATAQQTATIVTQDIGRARDLVKNAALPTTGLVGNFLKDVGGTEANDVRALVQTIRANVGFDKLQNMRANSPTGGALGPVSDAENALLQATLGNLEQSQTKEQFIQNLDRLEEIYDRVINGPRTRTKDDDARPATVIDGYTIRPK